MMAQSHRREVNKHSIQIPSTESVMEYGTASMNRAKANTKEDGLAARAPRTTGCWSYAGGIVSVAMDPLASSTYSAVMASAIAS